MIEKQFLGGGVKFKMKKTLRSNPRFISSGTHFRVLECAEFRIHKIWNLNFIEL